MKKVTTECYENLTRDLAEKAIADAIQKGCNIIFTTTPEFVQASVQAAIAHPEVKILNCSLNTSHRYIRTYYARMYEAKFLMGAIAGAMAENGQLAYIADYPIFGTIANINAFALGAKMVNPRAQIYLEWSTLKDVDLGIAMDNVIKKGCYGCIRTGYGDSGRCIALFWTVSHRKMKDLVILLCHCGTGENFMNS